MIYDFELDGPPTNIISRAPPPQWHSQFRHLMNLAFIVGCGFVLAFALMPDVTHDGERPRRAQCTNNLKQIALALHSYHDKYGVFPPAYIADASGRPMHSWRVLILPFLDHEDLYDQYDFNEPWDGQHNIKLLGLMPGELRCPSRAPSRMSSMTSYVAITGPGTMFPGGESVKFTDVTDGVANTLMIVETDSVGVPWTAPVDLNLQAMSFRINDRARPSISSLHPGVVNVSYADGRCDHLKEGLDPRQLRSMITIAGGEPIANNR
jgi:prepilin-type processing-associated H-X9-DG protein